MTTNFFGDEPYIGDVSFPLSEGNIPPTFESFPTFALLCPPSMNPPLLQHITLVGTDFVWWATNI